MNQLTEALWKDYGSTTEKIGVLTGSNDMEKLKLEYEERDKIRNELIKCEQIERELGVKIREIEYKKISEVKRNKIDLVVFGISTGLSFYAIQKTFKFDGVATITSTLGRTILNGFIPKIFKK